MSGNVVRVGTQVTGVAKSSSDLDKLRDRFDRLQKQGAKGVGVGVGAGVGVAAFNMLGRAADMAADFIGNVVKAGMEEEVSISRLGASLKANIPNWDGHTDAIEKAAAANIKLGFADDDSRNSMTLLVAATHDVSAALDIQTTAMDLARFKRISLSEATEALTKVEAGSYRILKSLGIVLKDGATQTEALAAVQAVAEGQAADYAQTIEGKLLVAQTKLGEKMDELGTKSLPLVETGLGIVETGLDGVNDLAANTEAEFQGISDAADYLSTSLLQMTWPEYEAKAKAARIESARLRDSIGGTSESTMSAMSAFRKVPAAASSAADGFKALRDIAAEAQTAMEKMADAYDTAWGHLSSIADGAAEDIFGPQIRASERAANAREIAAQRAIIASKKSTTAEKQDARDRLLALQQEGLGIQIEMAGRGELTKAAYATLISTLQKQAASGNVEIATSAKLALAELAKLRAGVVSINRIGLLGGFKGGARAAGGPASGVTLVGEEGPEIVDLPAGSFVHNNADSTRMAARLPAAGGGATNIYVTANLSPTGYSPAQAEQIANAIGPAIVVYLRRRGLLAAA